MDYKDKYLQRDKQLTATAVKALLTSKALHNTFSFFISVTVSSPGASRSGFARFRGLLRLVAEELAPDQHVLSNQ